MLVKKLDSQIPHFREHVLAVLLLLASSPASLSLLRDSTLGLKGKLQGILDAAKGFTQEQKDSVEDEIKRAEELLSICSA